MADAMSAQQRSGARPLLRFGLALTLGWLLWLPAGETFVRTFCAAGDAILAPLTLGKGGHVRLDFAAAPRATDALAANETWNARLWLRIDQVPKEHTVRVNPRRLAYLPVVLLCALVAALPLGWRRRALILGIGLATLFASAVGSIWITAAFLFGRVPGLVYDLAPWQRGALHFAYESLVTPLGNRLILPFFLVAPALLESTLLRATRPDSGATGSCADDRPRAARGAG